MDIRTKTDGRTVTSYTTTETAALVRKALKAAFPGVKFSVRTSYYSMGSSVYIGWTDGPTSPEVDLVTRRFTSKTFNGSDDSTNYHTQMVDGREVEYSGWISGQRRYSPELRAIAEQRAALCGCEVNTVLWTLRGDGVVVKVKEAWERERSAPATETPAGMWPNESAAPGVH